MQKDAQWVRSIKKGFQNENLPTYLMILAVLIAMAWANSPWKASYHQLWQIVIPFQLLNLQAQETLHHWVNDGLMAVFFFLIGLEMKREILAGELSSFKKARLPIFCAVGGMLVPALIFYLFNKGLDTQQAWAIPMATDIAFALAILKALKNRIPAALIVLLTAMAVIDDLGGILVIALYFTKALDWSALFSGLFFIGVIVVFNRLKIRKPWLYLLLGVLGVWLGFLHSGVHATIVGILIAMATPLQSDIDDQTYLHRLTQLSNRFEKTCTTRAGHLITSTEQIEIVEEIREISIAAESPLQRLEHNVAPFVNYFVLPLFALSNAGVEIKIDSLAGIVSPLGAGIGLGLILGKFIGVAGTAFLVVALKWAELPRQVNRLHLIGIGLLAGIGFTMSIFITELSLADLQQKSTAKLTILIALVISVLLGYWTLRQSRPVPS